MLIYLAKMVLFYEHYVRRAADGGLGAASERGRAAPPAPCRNACRSDLTNLLTHLTDTART